MEKKERIAKIIARSGVCSRRDAEKLIELGQVKIDGLLVTKPGINISSKQQILINDKPIAKASNTRLWLFNKPKGYITSHKDPQNRPNVFDILPVNMPRVISVGRLDFNTEGLLLLTNDGQLSRHLELPVTGIKRIYKVRAYGRVENSKFDILRKGVMIQGVKYAPSVIEVDKTQGDNLWMQISLTEGKNREIRKMLEFIDLKVNRLIRIAYGPFQLENLKSGQVKEVTADKIRDLYNENNIR
jgi:23S rRNA pseudouridine2605 synthase